VSNKIAKLWLELELVLVWMLALGLAHEPEGADKCVCSDSYREV